MQHLSLYWMVIVSERNIWLPDLMPENGEFKREKSNRWCTSHTGGKKRAYCYGIEKSGDHVKILKNPRFYWFSAKVTRTLTLRYVSVRKQRIKRALIKPRKVTIFFDFYLRIGAFTYVLQRTIIVLADAYALFSRYSTYFLLISTYLYVTERFRTFMYVLLCHTTFTVCIFMQARIQGGLGPPPIFWGKNKGAKNHTHRIFFYQNRTTTKQDTG